MVCSIAARASKKKKNRRENRKILTKKPPNLRELNGFRLSLDRL